MNLARALSAILIGIALLTPAAAVHAQLLLGVGGGVVTPANTYAPTGVSLNHTNVGRITALTGAVDGPGFILSFWSKQSWDQNFTANNSTTSTNSRVISNGDFTDSCELLPFCVIWDSVGSIDANFRVNLGNAAQTIEFLGSIPEVSTNVPYVNAQWNHYFISCNMRYAGGKRICAVRMNGTPLTNASLSDTGTQFDVNWSNALGWLLGGVDHTAQQYDILTADVADVWFDPAHNDVSLSGATPVVPDADVAQFIDAHGKPVNLGTNGSTPFGYQPCIFLTGGAASFATNLGTCGTFTATKSTSTSPGLALQDAPVTPGYQTPHRAYLAWRNAGGVTSLGANGSTITLSTVPVNNPIAAGDFLVIVEEEACSGNNDPGTFPTPTGFTQLFQRYENSTSTVRWAYFYKVADGSENGAFVLNPPSCGGSSGLTWTMADYKGVDPVNPIDVSGVNTTSTTSATSIPATGFSITTTVNNDLLTWTGITFGSQRGPYTVPTGEQTRLDQTVFNASAARPQVLIADEQLGAAGSTGTKTGSAATANPSRAVMVALKPN